MKFRKNAGDVSNAQNKIQLFPILLINFIGTLGFSIVYASTIIEDRTTVSGAIYTSRANRKNRIDNDYRKANNIQRNEFLDKYRSMMWLMSYSFRFILQIILVGNCRLILLFKADDNEDIKRPI